MNNNSRIDKLERTIDYLRLCFSKVDARFDTISEEARVLTNRVHELESNDTKHGKLNQSSLEERTELPIQPDWAKSWVNDTIESQRVYMKEYFDSLEAESMGCQGDTLGQCDHGCDGISDRGSCIDEPMFHCKPPEPTYCRAGVTQCGRPYPSCEQCSPAMHEAMSMPACKHGERACKYELSDADSCDYSNKPRRARVDNDDTKCGSDVDSGLEGSTEGKDSEQKANMSDSGPVSLREVVADGLSMLSDSGRLAVYQYVFDDGCMPMGAAGDVARRAYAAVWDVELYQPQVVYCCNGAMYEAR